MAWHRTYRPRTIADLHLTQVREALQQFMQQGKFPQVLLFAGPKGTGKTSASRIIGNLLNDPKNEALVDAIFFGKKLPKDLSLQEPDTQSALAERIYNGNSFVVQEMDAASYRGIDDVRALRERVMVPPQEGKVAVYILDEAHMFTTEAFNALLKLLEEPPAHAVFILATTELHKIPDTIASRSTKLDFRKADAAELAAALQHIVQQEKLTAEPAALTYIADRADGSFRDAVKLLEAVAQSGSVTLAAAETMLGQNLTQSVVNLISTVLEKDAQGVSAAIAVLRDHQVQEAYFYKVLFSFLHRNLVQAESDSDVLPALSPKVARFLLQELLKGGLQQPTPISFLPLEVKLLELIERSQQQNGTTPPAKKKIHKTSVKPPSPQNDSVVSAPDLSVPTPNLAEAAEYDLQEMGRLLMEQWEQFLSTVQQRNATLAALLRSSKLILNTDGIPQVGVYYKFHQEQLQQRKYMALIQDCAKDVIGVPLPLQVALQATPAKAALVEVEEASQDLVELAEEALL